MGLRRVAGGMVTCICTKIPYRLIATPVKRALRT
jgi:hypothetical protein